MSPDFTFPVFQRIDDAPYSITANGQTIPIEKGTHVQVTYYARLQLHEPVQIIVQHHGDVDALWSIRPDRYRSDIDADGRKIAFTVADHTSRIIQVDGLPPLFIFFEPVVSEPETVDSKVISIAPSDASALQHTPQIQAAIDKVSASGGGTVYLEPGVHRSHVIHLRSHVALHLAAGAVLQGTGNPDDYEANHGRRALILIEEATGASIRGQGVIDGAGHLIQEIHGTKAHLIDALLCQDLVIEDVVLRNPGSWTLHLIGCRGVSISRIKIIGDWKLRNTDGIDPDMSQHVTIESCFVYSGDDALVVKTTGGLGIQKESHTIAARDCVLMTHKTACKIGTESRYDIRDVVFENIEIVDSSRGCALWMRDGATYSDITFRNIRMNLMRFPGEQWSGEAYRVSIQERHGQGTMQRILFDRIRAVSPQRSIVFSRIDRPVTGVTFEDCTWAGDSKDDIPPVEVKNAEEITFVNCSVEVSGIARPFSHAFIEGKAMEAVQIR